MADLASFSITPMVDAAFVLKSSIIRESLEVPCTMPSVGTWPETLLARAIPAIRRRPDMEITLDMLATWGVPEDILDILRDYLANTVGDATSRLAAEKAVALRLVLGAAKRSGTVSRDDMRVLRKGVGKVQTDKELERVIERLVNN
jgi:hypothetical protein